MVARQGNLLRSCSISHIVPTHREGKDPSLFRNPNLRSACFTSQLPQTSSSHRSSVIKSLISVSHTSTLPSKQQPPNPPPNPPYHYHHQNNQPRNLQNRHPIPLPRHPPHPPQAPAYTRAHSRKDFIGVVKNILRARVVVDVECDVFELRGFRAEGREEVGVLRLVGLRGGRHCRVVRW
jgi:hypothetical protein